jgi:hypothetical protein
MFIERIFLSFDMTSKGLADTSPTHDIYLPEQIREYFG